LIEGLQAFIAINAMYEGTESLITKQTTHYQQTITMSNNNNAKSVKSAKSATVTKPDAKSIETAAVEVDNALQAIVEATMIAACSLTEAVKDAVSKYKKLGIDDESIAGRIKAVYARAQKSNSVNKALRSAGLRQRALRSDAGKARDAVSILDALIMAGKAKGKAKAKGEADETDAAERLAKRAWAFADEDMDAAVTLLKEAISMIESGDMDDTAE